MRAFVLLASLALLTSCRTVVPNYEGQLRDRITTTARTYRPDGQQPTLPALTASSPAADYIHFALLKHPQVEAAFYDWRAATETITSARSLPDPKLTFEADITTTLMTLMPGFMFDLMGPGKRTAMGREAAAGTEVAHRNYVTAILRTAADVRKAWLELAYIEEAHRLHTLAIASVGDSFAIADATYVTGRGMSSLETQVALQNELAEHQTDHAILTDRLAAARIRFKSALGLQPTDPDPAWPAFPLIATPLPSEDELWRHALAANPDLGKMRAMVEMAIAGVTVAGKSRTPDIELGAMVDLKANPLMVRPTASVSLPLWRDKIAATIAAAEARRDAATARLNAEELTLAAEFAQMLFMVRESDRMIAAIDQTSLPNIERLSATVEASYQSGMSGAAMIFETRLKVTMLRLNRLALLLQRENAVTDLLLLTADIAPSDLTPPST